MPSFGDRTRQFPELIARVHRSLELVEFDKQGTGGERPIHRTLDILWPRGYADDSPYGRFLSMLRAEREIGHVSNPQSSWAYDPSLALREARHGSWLTDEPTARWTSAVIEMAENGMALNNAVVRARSYPKAAYDTKWQSMAEAWPSPVRTASDKAGEIFTLARSGANEGRSTKSKITACPHPAWRDVTRTYGLRGFNAIPVVALGGHGFGLQSLAAANWEADYITMLLNMFYLEYNIDTLGGVEDNHVMTDLTHALDYPDLPYDLRLRRLHITCNMAFFDAKRKSESLFEKAPTAGVDAWVFRNRDMWRDFKAADSSMWGHYLSYADGYAGRNDLMISGLTADWTDIGPDLRYSECGNSVLTMTRGSITCSDLLHAYERTVWMLNDHWTSDGDIRSERYTGCAIATGVGIWAATDHRHDIWRYYSLAFDTCKDATQRNLHRVVGLLADCYTESFAPAEPDDFSTLSIPRSALRFDVRVEGQRFNGDVILHQALVHVVHNGRMPMSVIDNLIILPMLLRQGRITPEAFLDCMDRNYCTNAAVIANTLHVNNFDRQIGVALAALVMEQWWSGIFYAIGVGSLIEAQPGRVAHDRSHG
jgi:hypothetical protein